MTPFVPLFNCGDYINTAEGVSGVLFAQADCDHPQGQGTVDVIVTGTAGEATEGLLNST